MQELLARLASDPAWITGLAEQVSDEILAALPELEHEPELVAGVRASTESVIRVFIQLAVNDLALEQAEPPPAAVSLARDFVRRGVSIETLLRTYSIGHAAFFRRWVVEARAAV